MGTGCRHPVVVDISEEGGRRDMRKLLVGAVAVMCFAGCSGPEIQRSEFWQHDTMYKNWDHTRFSMTGFKNPTKETCRESTEQGWWGIPVEPKE